MEVATPAAIAAAKQISVFILIFCSLCCIVCMGTITEDAASVNTFFKFFLNVFQWAIFPKNQPFCELLRGLEDEMAEISMNFRQLASKTWRKPRKTLQKPKESSPTVGALTEPGLLRRLRTSRFPGRRRRW